MAVGAGFGYFSASMGSVRLGRSGVVGRGSCSLEFVGVMCGLGGFGGSGGFDGCWHGFGALWRSSCRVAPALVSMGSWFPWLLLGAVRRVVVWRCPAG